MTQEFTAAEFEIEYYRAMYEWAKGGRVGINPSTSWELSGGEYWSGSGPGARTPQFSDNLFYRWKPAPKRTVTIGYKADNGIWAWNLKTLIAPEVECPATGSTVWLLGNSHVPLVGFQHNDCTEKWLKDGELFATCEDAQAMADWLTVCRKGGT